jgi:catechol 2,3-dioxygenase-like lactoylglutathione lyase family enzyme
VKRLRLAQEDQVTLAALIDEQDLLTVLERCRLDHRACADRSTTREDPAPWRSAGLESAMTSQCYTKPRMPPPGALHVRELGHVSLFVRDLDTTRRFYRDVLGLTETGTGKNGLIVFFATTDGHGTSGTKVGQRHHDISCELARADGPGPQPKGVPGLYHIAFTVDDVVAARQWVESHGLVPFGEYERGFCVRDPDGHEIELYTERAASV